MASTKSFYDQLMDNQSKLFNTMTEYHHPTCLTRLAN
jgi:hypothetical protein